MEFIDHTIGNNLNTKQVKVYYSDKFTKPIPTVYRETIVSYLTTFISNFDVLQSNQSNPIRNLFLQHSILLWTQ